MTDHHPALARLIKKAKEGDPDSAEALAYAFTGMICASMPGFDLGFHRRPDPKNPNKLSWFSAAGHEVVRVDLVGPGLIAFQAIDSKGIIQVDLTFTSIDEMIHILRAARAKAKEGRSPVRRRVPTRRKGRTSKV